jgi:flagellin
VANQNIQDGISFLQLRDAAMAEVGDMLQRLRDLAVRAANEAPMTNADRQKLQDEATSLVDGINQINDATKFNGNKVFDISFQTVSGGSFGFYTGGIKTMSIDLAGIYKKTGAPVTIRSAWYDGWAAFPDMNLLSPDGAEAFGWLYGDPSQTFPNVPAPTVEGYLDMDIPPTTRFRGDPDVHGLGTMDSADSIRYSGWDMGVNSQGYYEEYFTITNPAEGMWTIIIDNEDSLDRLYGIFVNEPTRQPVGGNFLQVGPNSNAATNSFDVERFEVDTYALSITANLKTAAGAQASITSLDASLDALNTRRADDGIRVRRLMSIVNNNNTEMINVEASRSRIEDADMANEITEMTKANIVSRANSSALAYSGGEPSLVRALLDTMINPGKL